MYVEMRLSLPSREHIADNIELMALSHSMDGWVGVTNCDKITPGMLMAAMRINLPAIMLTGGPMMAGFRCGCIKTRDLNTGYRYLDESITDEVIENFKGSLHCSRCLSGCGEHSSKKVTGSLGRGWNSRGCPKSHSYTNEYKKLRAICPCNTHCYPKENLNDAIIIEGARSG